MRSREKLKNTSHSVRSAILCLCQSNVDEERLITQFQISTWSDEDCSIPITRLRPQVVTILRKIIMSCT